MVDSIQRLPLVTPTWATDSGVALEPSPSERQAGWVAGFKPPARWQNDYQRKVFQIADNAMAVQRKNWTRVKALQNITDFVGGIDPNESPLVFHKGYYYYRSQNGHWRIYKTSDFKGWLVIDPTPATVLAEDTLTLASNGSRIVITATGVAGNNFYSDTDLDSYTGSLTGTGTEPRIFYMPGNDIWIGSSSLGTIVSQAGIAYAATSGADGGTDSGNFQAAERPDGSIAVVGMGAANDGVFTVDGGVTWASAVSTVALDNFYYSAIVGNLVAWNSIGAREMSSTDGTWESFYKWNWPTGWQDIGGVFDMHGAIYSYGKFDDPSTALNPAIPGIIMTLDQGTTWEFVTTIDSLFEEASTFGYLNPVQPVIGHGPGANTGFVAMLGATTLSDLFGIIPPFPGQLFAAPLT